MVEAVECRENYGIHFDKFLTFQMNQHCHFYVTFPNVKILTNFKIPQIKQNISNILLIGDHFAMSNLGIIFCFLNFVLSLSLFFSEELLTPRISENIK